MKQSWLVLRSSSGCVLGSGNGASVLAFVAGQRFLNSCFKWIFVVAIESSRCLDLKSSVSPGQVVRWTFFIARMNVEGTVLKHAAWRDWANYFLVLFIWTIPLTACDVGLVGVSGVYHRQFDTLCLPVRMMLLFFSKTWRHFLLKMDWQSSSHRWSTDIKGSFFNAEKTWVSIAAGGIAKGK